MRWLFLLVLIAGCSSEHERGKNAKDVPGRPRMTDARKDAAEPVKEKAAEPVKEKKEK